MRIRVLFPFVICLVLLIGATRAVAQPTVRAVGSTWESTGNLVNGTAYLPSGTTAGDLLLWFCATAAEDICAGDSTCPTSGWTELFTPPSTTGTQLTVFRREATSGDVDGTCESCELSDPGNHALCVMVAITAGTWDTTTPINANYTTAVESTLQSTFTLTSPSGASTVDNTLVFCAMSGSLDNTNTIAMDLTETVRFNVTTTQGDDSSLLGASAPGPSAGTTWGDCDGDSGGAMRWAGAYFAIRPSPPTPTNTPSVTPTSTPTPTPTNTYTPTAVAPYCSYATFTPAANADDGYTQSVNNAAATLDTSATTAIAGKFDYLDDGTLKIEDVGLFRFDTSSLSDTATIERATLTVNISSVDVNGSRNLIGKWVGAESAWSTGDHEDTLSPTDAQNISCAGLHTGQWTFNLDNPSNVDRSGYTGLKFGASGGDPTASDECAIVYATRDSGTNVPVLSVYLCEPTATPTQTQTPSHTATATQTPTSTPITPPLRMPDVTGPTPGVPDGLYGFALDGDGKTDGVWGTGSDTLLIATLRDPNGLCQYTRSYADSASVATRQETLSIGAGGVSAGKCLHGESAVTGVVRRGLDTVADIVAVDIGAIYEWTQTWTAPRTGLCWGGPDAGQPCRVNHAAGQFAQGKNARCVAGLDFGSSCRPPGTPGMTPTPCLGDPAPNNPLASYCQPQVWNEGDGMGVTGCRAPGLCQERARLGAVKANVRRVVSAIQARKAIPLIIMPYLPASWRDSQCSTTGSPPITPLPDGTPVPVNSYKAAGEMAVCDLAHLNAWAHRLVEMGSDDDPPDAGGQLPWIDLNRLAAIKTRGQKHRILGDQILMSTSGKGHCTCLTDADCGSGGTCYNAQYCTAGTRNTCTTDADCLGSNSQVRPGDAWCITETGAEWVAEAFRACLEDWSNSKEPVWTLLGILNCSDPRIPMNPAFKTWPPNSPTVTATPPPTLTATSTPPGNPTATNTGTATPTWTPGGFTFTPTATVTPENISSNCSGQGGDQACVKIFPVVFRTLFNAWTPWIDPDRGGYGIQSSTGTGYSTCLSGTIDTGKCRIWPLYGASDFNNDWVVPTFDNEMLCNQYDASGNCSYDVATNTDHYAGQGKFQNADADGLDCSQTDWDRLWKWQGDPLMPVCGYCSDDGRTSCTVAGATESCAGANPSKCGHCSVTTSTRCNQHSECPGGETCTALCVAKCDQYRFGTGPNLLNADPPPGSDPAPPFARLRPKDKEVYYWESVRCYHEKYSVPIARYVYDQIRALDRADTAPVDKITDRCAENALTKMFSDMSKNFDAACVGTCAETPVGKPTRYCTFNADCPAIDGYGGACDIPANCQSKLAYCMNGWDAASVAGVEDCGSCALGPRDSEQQFTCPASCSTAQIPCATWKAWCEQIIDWIDPIRYGCRLHARPGYE